MVYLRQTPESVIPPNIAPKSVTPEIHFQINDSSATLIGQLATVAILAPECGGVSYFGFSVEQSQLFGVIFNALWRHENTLLGIF